MIAMELRRRGVDEDTAMAAVSEITDGEESAKRVLEKYLRGKELNRETYRKAYAHLISKGYDYDTAKSALGALKDDDED